VSARKKKPSGAKAEAPKTLAAGTTAGVWLGTQSAVFFSREGNSWTRHVSQKKVGGKASSSPSLEERGDPKVVLCSFVQNSGDEKKGGCESSKEKGKQPKDAEGSSRREEGRLQPAKSETE